MMIVHSYDCHQRSAILVRCVRCGKWWYMTIAAMLICLECRGRRDDV